MSRWDIKIGFNQSCVDTIELNDNITAQGLLDILVEKNLIDKTEIYYPICLLPDDRSGGVQLVDNSGYPYATITKANQDAITLEQAISRVANTPLLPKCPTCGSTNLSKQSVVSRGISGFLFGRHSVEGRAQFLCNNCGYQW